MINVVTKSGSNDLHGSAFYYLRHRAFSPTNDLGYDPAPTRQQYGASLGGPLVKDKTFFFTVSDGQREHQPSGSPVSTCNPLNTEFGSGRVIR